MESIPHPHRPVSLSPADEASELRDVGAADCEPELSEAFGYGTPADELTEREIDTLYRDEMERRARAGTAPAGYRPAECEACGVGIFVPESPAGDILCPECQREGEVMSAAEDGDDEPDPAPTGAALHPDYPAFASYIRRWPDDSLIGGISHVDEGGYDFNGDVARRDAWMSAATAEVLWRLDARKAA